MPKYVVTANLTLRSGPGKGHKAIGYLLKNSLVQADQLKDGWAHITDTEGRTGWSSAKYLRELDQPAPPGVPGIELPQPPGLGAYIVTVSNLNLRQGPGKNYGSLGTLAADEVVEAVAQSLDGQWLQVRKFNGLTGWASIKYVSKLVEASDQEGGELIVTVEVVNLRRGPGAGQPVVSKVRRGEVVKFVHASPNWSWIQVRKDLLTEGWCASKYLLERDMLTVPAEDLVSRGKHRVATYSLHLREGPRLEMRSLATLNFNQVVDVDDISSDGLWKRCVTAQGQAGWSMSVHLASLGLLDAPAESEEFPWLPIAFNELGTVEVPGKGSNPKILDYLASTDLFKYPYLPDETDWCAAFVNWCIKKSGTRTANSALAFPWSQWGKPLQSPRRGCVVIFHWDEGGHHVAFYLGRIGNYVAALGGNQSDAVWIALYHRRNVLAYRVPEDWPGQPVRD